LLVSVAAGTIDSLLFYRFLTIGHGARSVYGWGWGWSWNAPEHASRFPRPLLEWWRKGHGQSRILELGQLEPLTEEIAKAAGEALGRVNGATPIDATVASAARRGDRVFTSDPKDLQKLQRYFRAVVDIIAV
jgi:hypothetical protein